MTDVRPAFALADRYQRREGRIYLSGLQALVRLPLDQRRQDLAEGRNTAALIAGYEGSPLAGYDIELGRHADLFAEQGVVLRPALNEELAANAVQGTQLVGGRDDALHEGVTGYWYGKAPGLDRAADALRHANLGGASRHGGAVLMVGDDAAAKSSTNPSGSEPALAGLGIPTLVPGDPQGILDLGRHAVGLSRFSGLWVALKIATSVADGSATATVAPDRIRIVYPDDVVDGRPFTHQVTSRFMQPVLGELERSLHHERMELACRYAVANHLNAVRGSRRARIGVVAAGATHLDVCQALRSLGLDPDSPDGPVRLLELGMVFPLEPQIVAEFARDLEEIIVVEEKGPFIENALTCQLYGSPRPPRILGKRDAEGRPLLRAEGDLNAELIRVALATRLDTEVSTATPSRVPRKAAGTRRTLLPLTPRTPFFCSGCPHNRSVEAPQGALVGAGIGCAGMSLLMPEQRVGDVLGLTQMGGEGAPWIGMQPFLRTEHLFQNMGDGTFHHSGSLAIRASVAAGSRITYKLLYNSAVAMTGGQDVVGGMSVAAIARGLLAEGVRRVVVTTEDPSRYRRARLPRGVRVRHRDDLVEVQRELAAVDGVTVLIHDQECATELRRKRKRGLVERPLERVLINERVCEGCGDCGQKSNCLSVQPVETGYGRKTQIHQPSCNQDFSCLDGDCPSFISVRPRPQAPKRRSALVEIEDSFPEPESIADPDRFSVRVTGIGGTGVITVAQLIATAATIAGRHVRALDQTGLAQKGGAVVSDIKVSSLEQVESNKIGDGECDLYLGCDVLVAASEENLRVVNPSRTTATISTSEVPTGQMVIDPSTTFPAAAQIRDRFGAFALPERTRFLDARDLAESLFGDDQFANVFLVGVAYQSGALPLPAAHIEQAIALNGVAVTENVQSFRRGRQLVAWPEDFAAAVASVLEEPPSAARAPSPATLSELAQRLQAPEDSAVVTLAAARSADLVDYQDRAYAEEFLSFVTEVRAAECRVDPSRSELSEAVAFYLHKLMAYKDEYEVARLSIDATVAATVEHEFGSGARIHFRLHPPILRALGMRRKLRVGAWFRWVFRVLYAMRGLRRSRLNPFGWGRVRRTERALPGEYRSMIAALLPRATDENLTRLAEIASLPDMIRGYEGIKLASLERYRSTLEARLGELN